MKSTYIFPVLLTVASAYQYGSGSGLDNTFQAYNQKPNATGSVSLVGVDMTSNSSSGGQPRDWTAAVNVTDVPVSEGVRTNTVISFDAKGAFEANSTSWTTCVMIMHDVARNATENGQKDTGDCVATFGQQCKADWMDRVNVAFANAINQGSEDPCSSISTPQIPFSCTGLFTTDSVTGSIEANYTMGSAWWYAAESPPFHQASNFTAYETAATRIWPVFLMQGNNETTTYSTQMSCLRAKTATQGSHEIGDVPGGGSRIEDVWWSLAAVFAVMGFFDLELPRHRV
ncbi:hypothetical protein VTL71DRAFT_12274 [Oculimacula yallundae]|uniref:Uncharacterized protein n=1 Tax=Oculimacula yallundae TaxID=86028 RepID=A0ABR4CMN2_9HELO